MLAVTPPCGEAVCGAALWPAKNGGGIDFHTWPSIITESTLPEYYRKTPTLVVFQKGIIGNLIDDRKEYPNRRWLETTQSADISVTFAREATRTGKYG